MTPKEITIEALKGSIAKWEGIRDGTMDDRGTANCPLCFVFHHNGCIGCPVMNRTQRMLCHGSPYYDYDNASTAGAPQGMLAFHAQREVDFLYDLLEELTNE